MKKVFLYSIMVLMPRRFWTERKHYEWLGEHILDCFPDLEDEEILETSIGKRYYTLMKEVIGFQSKSKSGSPSQGAAFWVVQKYFLDTN